MLQFLAQAAPYLSAAGSFADILGVGKPKVKIGPTPSEREAQSLIMALSQPNNSLVEYETQGVMQQGVNDLLMALKQKQMMDARRQGRGLRGTFFAPERADETIDYLTSRSLPSLGLQARESAKSNIARRANALMPFAELERGRQQSGNINRGGMFDKFQAGGGFGGGIDALLKAFNIQGNPINASLPWQSAGNVRPDYMGGGYY